MCSTVRRLWSNEWVSALFAQAGEDISCSHVPSSSTGDSSSPSSPSASSCSYFLSHFERITAEGYQPTKQDILELWIPTTGMNKLKDNTTYVMPFIKVVR